MGCLGACLLMGILLVVVYVAAPFEWRVGPRSASSVGLQALQYFSGNFGEELLFRGYALIALARMLGTTRALWILALPFGLFHAPGLDAVSLGKMILTTGAMHFLFAYAYLGSRSLWAAVSLHAVANVLLHAVSGFGQGASAFSVVLVDTLPEGFDRLFVAFFLTPAVLALILSRQPAVRRGAAWLKEAGAAG